jgi:hypothetical protein
MHGRFAISSSVERRLRREGHSAARRELALKLRREGKTLAAIGAVLGVSTTRALQMVRKAARLIREREEGAPAQGTPSFDSSDPLAAGRNRQDSRCVPPPTT